MTDRDHMKRKHPSEEPQIVPEQQLRRYLLGQCSPEEVEHVEQAALGNTDVSDLLSVIEDELTEEYVEDQLNGDDKVCFERQFRSPERRNKILVSATLLQTSGVNRMNSRKAEARTKEPQKWTTRDIQKALGILTEGKESGRRLSYQEFDESYLKRLRSGDPQTEEDFVAYFGELVRCKLRSRVAAPQVVEELRKETFNRVLVALCSEGKLLQPKQLASFVNSVCNNVLLEYYRSSPRSNSVTNEARKSPRDRFIDLTAVRDKFIELKAISAPKEWEEKMRQILDELPERDRRLLKEIFSDEKHDKDLVFVELGVDSGYLTVLLHRIKQLFWQKLDSVSESRRGLAPKNETTG